MIRRKSATTVVGVFAGILAVVFFEVIVVAGDVTNTFNELVEVNAAASALRGIAGNSLVAVTRLAGVDAATGASEKVIGVLVVGATEIAGMNVAISVRGRITGFVVRRATGLVLGRISGAFVIETTGALFGIVIDVAGSEESLQQSCGKSGSGTLGKKLKN